MIVSWLSLFFHLKDYQVLPSQLKSNSKKQQKQQQKQQKQQQWLDFQKDEIFDDCEYFFS